MCGCTRCEWSWSYLYISSLPYNLNFDSSSHCQEIEKTVDQNTLWSLLMPWELGRCSFEAGSRHVDVKNVIWLGTSNIGHDLVFTHRDARKNPEEPMSRQEYVELMSLLRPQVSEKLGVCNDKSVCFVFECAPN